MNWKQRLFRFLGKDPEPVVVSFLSGPEPHARAMFDEIRRLVPEREHWAVTELELPDATCIHPSHLPGPLRRKRIGLAPTLFTDEPEYRPLRWWAFRLAPTKLLAYNSRLERHHLRFSTFIASFLFLRNVPLDRIWLRPAWLFPWNRDRTVRPSSHVEFNGRPLSATRRRIGILTPYFPYPLSHGGAVRMYNLLREAARDFDVFLFSFSDETSAIEKSPVLEYCAKVVIFPQPRHRAPRWSTLLPPEVDEFRSDYVAAALERCRSGYGLDLLQVEYTQLATYAGDVLVEHDVTFDLYEQIRERRHTLSARWDAWRWRRFEESAVRRFRRVVVMSSKDAYLLGAPGTRIIPNGVDLTRFRPEPEQPGFHLLFVGSFRHFPNVIAYRFFVEEVWPLLAARVPQARLTVIAGPAPELYWDAPPQDDRITVHGFISDVRPFYDAANVVIVPTKVSAGTNLKVLEAMAMERAVVSTSSGCAGLGLEHGRSVWLADTAEEFAAGVERLLLDPDSRYALAAHARSDAQRFDWQKLGVEQRLMWNELIADNAGIRIRRGNPSDAAVIDRIQNESHAASHWEPDSYFHFDVWVAEVVGEVAGFLVSRNIAEDETEVLNLAVAPAFRRRGVATCLLEALPAPNVFLEVRESNQLARNLYEKRGFWVVGRREDYYEDPPEAALVMSRSRAQEG